ncbi:hypothetical protein ACFQV8_40490 [Pseudonocardia benzenivorans]
MLTVKCLSSSPLTIRSPNDCAIDDGPTMMTVLGSKTRTAISHTANTATTAISPRRSEA